MGDNNERNAQMEAFVAAIGNANNPFGEADENENEGDAGNNNNNNNMVDIDLDEDEEDGDNDSTYDGGVAANPDANNEDQTSKPKKHSSECDLVSTRIQHTAMRKNQYIFYVRNWN